MVWMHIYQSVVQTNREGKCVVLNHGMNVGGVPRLAEMARGVLALV